MKATLINNWTGEEYDLGKVARQIEEVKKHNRECDLIKKQKLKKRGKK